MKNILRNSKVKEERHWTGLEGRWEYPEQGGNKNCQSWDRNESWSLGYCSV